jgi:hypothetical protein
VCTGPRETEEVEEAASVYGHGHGHSMSKQCWGGGVWVGTGPARRWPLRRYGTGSPIHQGLTLVHFSAQLQRFLWDRGCV